MTKRLGFTLSEILIALTIIGVVAALTTPRFIGNATKKQFTTKFKTTMNLLNSAAKEFKMEEGGYDYTGNKSHTVGATNISVILQDKVGAKLITDIGGDGKPANKFNSIWTGEGLLYSTGKDYDPGYPSNLSIITATLSGGFDACSNSKVKENDKTNVTIPFGCSTTDNVTSKPNKTLLLKNGAYIFVTSATDACNFRNVVWNGTTYVTPNLDPNATGYNVRLCLAFIDVNGPKGPNKLTTCVGNTNMIFPESSSTCTEGEGTMSYASVGDIFPVWFYDDSVAPANTAANSVWLDRLDD